MNAYIKKTIQKNKKIKIGLPRKHADVLLCLITVSVLFSTFAIFESFVVVVAVAVIIFM